MCVCFFFFQAEDGIRDLVRSRGLGDVYKRQVFSCCFPGSTVDRNFSSSKGLTTWEVVVEVMDEPCLLYTSDAADERSSVDLGGRRIIKKKK